jgi:hypothetical protein
MVRARWAVLALAAGCFVGCSTLSNHPLFHKRCDTCTSEGCCGDIGSDGVVMNQGGPLMIPPTTRDAVPPANVPPLAPPPRLVPQQQSQPTPYFPQ